MCPKMPLWKITWFFQKIKQIIRNIVQSSITFIRNYTTFWENCQKFKMDNFKKFFLNTLGWVQPLKQQVEKWWKMLSLKWHLGFYINSWHLFPLEDSRLFSIKNFYSDSDSTWKNQTYKWVLKYLWFNNFLMNSLLKTTDFWT